MKARARRVKIRGETWRIIVGRPPANKCDALCCFDRKTIYIRKTADLTRCIIHEVIHACQPDLSEEAVMEIEDALATSLECVPPKPKMFRDS